ncbi:hypothetical protein J5N97_026341 [Dioscorea zingiberensis]|uniref:Cation/H+ exchanger domain-containing protein n=1 Tax=Dioscorea zingiberensis TaxID=325984 RepID=A0A9D5C339_9LILI|nr:hypothetical protein J5N97_026341 [Dioscorea zingiberensis]
MEGNGTAAEAPDWGSPPPPGKDQQAAGWGILLQISMLVLAFLIGHLLRRRKFYYLHEASASLLIDLYTWDLILRWRSIAGHTWGLRGAMAFALALQSVHELPEGHGQTIFTATTAIVILTVLLIGGSTGTMLEALEVVGDGHNSPLGETRRYGELQQSNYVAPSCEEGTSSGSRIKMKLKEFHKNTATFTALDKNYLTPFFTTQNDDEDDPDDNSDSGGGFRGPH